LQWELLATSWKRNFDIWLKKEEMIYIKAIGFLYYWGYMRWKHGKKTTKPILDFFGFPTGRIYTRIGKECDVGYCNEAT
ncbi:MAG: hypothetical protein AB1779_04000, partial [Candidatus Thermoplasmatota archaeon]